MITESIIEDVSLAWLESLGYAVPHLPAPARAAAGGSQSIASRQAGGPDIARVSG
ncbi:MAG: hypothetical protein HY848_12105 [Betaproteobacteria bacterium]|nr:hypothetical protein [Betaproteobacteria bacterium]